MIPTQKRHRVLGGCKGQGKAQSCPTLDGFGSGRINMRKKAAGKSVELSANVAALAQLMAFGSFSRPFLLEGETATWKPLNTVGS